VPPEHGRWTGLAEGYHLDLWGDRPWEVPNNVECLKQLQRLRMRDGLSTGYAREADEVRQALINLFQDAISAGGAVVVRRD
jgi:hypothetical protein